MFLSHVRTKLCSKLGELLKQAGLFSKEPFAFHKRQLRAIHTWQWFLLQSCKQIWLTFGKTTRRHWLKRYGNHLGPSTILLSFGVTFLALPAIVMNSWWILVHEGSLKYLSWFRIQHLTIAIQRILFEFEETCCIFLLHWRVAHRGRFPVKPIVWMNWNNSNNMFKLQMLLRSMQGMSACRI